MPVESLFDCGNHDRATPFYISEALANGRFFKESLLRWFSHLEWAMETCS